MKIFVSYEDFREPFHVSPDQTVGVVKQMVTVVKVLNGGLFWELLCQVI
jgi:hypothetical protein